MNNVATVVDTWRLITYNANALQSNLTVTFGGQLGTTGNNPVNFNGTQGELNAGLRFDPPFTGLLERNNYRQALINYQQDRRTLIQYEDSINQTLRQDLRSLPAAQRKPGDSAKSRGHCRPPRRQDAGRPQPSRRRRFSLASRQCNSDRPPPSTC